MIEVINIGTNTAFLHGAGLRLSLHRRIYLGEIEGELKFPCALKPGESCRISKHYSSIVELLRWEGYQGDIELSGFVMDRGGNLHVSGRLLFNLDE